MAELQILDKMDNAATNIAFLTTTKSAWEAMLNDCRNATTSIYYEQYILSNDQCGHEFLNVFLDKAKQGVKVTLIFDFMGSLDIRNLDIIDEIRRHGGEVTLYRPLKLYNLVTPKKWFPRTHLKCMIIDCEIGYLGSTCIAERMKDWRDTLMRCEGALVNEMIDEFNIKQDRLDCDNITLKQRDPDYNFQLNDPYVQSNPVYDDLLAHINKAKNYIYMVTPYFIAPDRLKKALDHATNRGVKVTIMASRKTDVKLADLAARDDFQQHLKDGIDIRLYEPTVIHSKYAVVDGEWATVGSTNLDYLSLHENREANVAIQNKAVVKQLENHFIQDLEHCFQVDWEYCKKRTWDERLASAAAKLMKKIL